MRILLVDDHTLFRDALAEVLRRLDDEVRVFSAGTAAEACASAAYYGSLDLVLLDLCLPGAQGVSLLAELLEQLVTVPVVILSASEQPEDVRAALDAGAAGYIPKTTGAQDMLTALRQVIAGEVYVPATLLATVSSVPDHQDPTPCGGGPEPNQRLTERQREVLRLLSQGLSNKAIANRLALTVGTVKLHVSAILRTLDVGNRTEAVTAARERGLLGNRPRAS